MISGFFRRKLAANHSLAERLKSTREKKGLSLSDAETESKIKAKYLEALEASDWSILPTAVYTRGFVLAYAKVLGMPATEVLPLFEAELGYQKSQRGSGDFAYRKSVKDARILLTPKLLGYAVIALFVASMFGYIIYQISSFAGSPNLKLVSPTNNAVVEGDSIEVEGITDPDIFLTVNEENIPVTKDGRFLANLRLHRGVNVIKVKAVNKTEKETTQVITVEYKPKTAANFEAVPQN